MQASELIEDFEAQRAQMGILRKQAKGAAQGEPHPPGVALSRISCVGWATLRARTSPTISAPNTG